MNELAPRQRKVYNFIIAYSRRHGYPPTMREIAAHLGVNGNLGIIKHLAALEKKGYIARSAGSSRGIRVTLPEAGHPDSPERIFTGADDASAVFLPVVGSVRAGMPQPPLEDIREYYSLDRNVARSGGTFFLQVKGDSMINAAIRDGDLALIRPQETARNRDIVVALVDGEATLKRFYSEKNQIRLQPENPNYEPIIITAGSRDVAIVGKVVGIYRSLE
jgi:repressor LexA